MEPRSSVEQAPPAVFRGDRQVRLKGGDPYTRAKFSVFLEELRGDFRDLLYKRRPGTPTPPDFWSVPVQVRLWGGFGDVHVGEETLTTLRLDQHFAIEMEVQLHDRFDEDAFRLAVVRALLLEMVLAPWVENPGGFPLEDDAKLKAPEWIAHGFDQILLHRRGGGSGAFYRGLLESGQTMAPVEIFSLADAASLDPVRLGIFRASAAAMVEALLGQPDGDAGLRGFLGDLGRPAPPATEALLRQHFPAFRELDQGLEKWWALELASLGRRQSLDYLDRAETENLLDEALAIRFDGAPSATPDGTPIATPVERAGWRVFPGFPKSKSKGKAESPAPAAFVGTLDQFDLYLRRDGVRERLSEAHGRLQVLKRSGSPLYRPVFAAYEGGIQRLLKGDTKDLAAEFASIAEMRKKVGETLARAEDYLNHFEAARAPRRSDAFDGYLKTRRALDKAKPKRQDAISRHLDSLE